MAFAMVTHWVCNFGIGQLFLPAVARYGVSTVYLGFAMVRGCCECYTLPASQSWFGHVINDRIARIVMYTYSTNCCSW